ncbi:hypothetical protein [Salininema proteolyticum]|uniref:Alpha/beta hydrolase n=1 Tax=Salininema proteolyticum TaxID=1607685 RepID=A0ABV8TV91_9ACTN
MSFADWHARRLRPPAPAAAREVLTLTPTDALEYDDDPVKDTPLLLIPDSAHEAQECEKLWMPRLAASAHECAALNFRGKGATPAGPRKSDLRAHDIVQTAATLEHQAVLVAFADSALPVLEAATRYPAAGVVLLDPVLPDRDLPALVGSPRMCVVARETDVHEKAMARLRERFDISPLTVGGGGDLYTGAQAEAAADAVISWL